MATSNQEHNLVEQLRQLTSRPSFKDDFGARKEALQLSKKLTASLEKPEDVAVSLAFSPIVPVTIRIAVHLELFRHIVDNGTSISSKELATLSGGEELLIIRILRSVSSIGLVDEVGERLWQANPLTKAMTIDGIAAGHRMLGEMVAGAAQKAPKYLREAGYRCPTDPKDGLMQYAFQTKLTSFELFSSIPEVLRDFTMFMGNTMGARSYWVDWFPVQERLLDGATTDLPLLVDVGGGRGHDLLAFHEKYALKGRLILQDLASVTDNIGDLDPAIECMPYDFFSPQPVEGARAYFYHHILHDWSDVKCMEILAQVKASMKPGYSRLLIHEMIIPEQGASTFHAMLDMSMMAFNSGMERTERQWRELLESASFEVLKVWPPLEEDADGIIEAVLKE
ncbi:putative O-methyltransferase [Hypoxylon cercidicola]|nr:putative O-methyltransferase [Hypoxylon cercidicola]